MRHLLIVLGLAACEPRGEIVIAPEAARANAVETVFVGTTRGVDPETGNAFSKTRNQFTRYARLDIAIPPEREPRRDPLDAAPTCTRSADRVPHDARRALLRAPPSFRADLARALAQKRRGTREAVVFVHGFNNTFAEGAYRLAQLGYDLDLGGVLVHYSWPSLGHPLGYAYDRDSALFARDGLESLLDQVVAAGAERVLIVAHSMGSALTMETLRQLAISRKTGVQRRIAGVVLISPDIDVDVFRAEAMRIGTLPQPFLIFTSKKDRALALSARLSGQRDRLGNVTDVAEIADLKVTLLDTTAFSTGVGHFNAGNSPALLAILGGIADVDAALAASQTGRTGLLPGAVLTVQSATQIVLSPVTAISGVSALTRPAQIDVEGPAAAMLQMRRRDLKHQRAERRLGQPLRHLMAQHADALRDRPVIFAALALAGDDENQPLAGTVGVQDEADQFGMRLGQRHAVQVDPRLGAELAARQLLMRTPVDPHRLRREPLLLRRDKVMRRRHRPGHLADVEIGWQRLGVNRFLLRLVTEVGGWRLPRPDRPGEAATRAPKVTLFGRQPPLTPAHGAHPSARA